MGGMSMISVCIYIYIHCLMTDLYTFLLQINVKIWMNEDKGDQLRVGLSSWMGHVWPTFSSIPSMILLGSQVLSAVAEHWAFKQFWSQEKT